MKDWHASWPFGRKVMNISRWSVIGIPSLSHYDKLRIQNLGQKLEGKKGEEWIPSDFSGEISFYVGAGVTVHAIFEDGVMVRHSHS